MNTVADLKTYMGNVRRKSATSVSTISAYVAVPRTYSSSDTLTRLTHGSRSSLRTLFGQKQPEKHVDEKIDEKGGNRSRAPSVSKQDAIAEKLGTLREAFKNSRSRMTSSVPNLGVTVQRQTTFAVLDLKEEGETETLDDFLRNGPPSVNTAGASFDEIRMSTKPIMSQSSLGSDGSVVFSVPDLQFETKFIKEILFEQTLALVPKELSPKEVKLYLFKVNEKSLSIFTQDKKVKKVI